MNAFVRPARHIFLPIDEIDLSQTVRPHNAAVVAELARSIQTIGLQTPLTCIVRDGRHILVAGRNRLEALRVIGCEQAPVRIAEFDDVEARMWAISENLFRAELTVSQRAEQVAEYAKLAAEKRDAEKPGQVAQVSGGRGKEGGDSLAARDLGITREEVRRDKTIATLSEQTKQAARDAGLDDNQSALLKAARAPTPEAQITVLTEIKERGRVADNAPPPEPDERGHEPPEEPPLASDPIERPRPAGAKPLRDLVGISGGELARWIKITTPNDRPHVIRVLETAAAILRDELGGGALPAAAQELVDEMSTATAFLNAQLANGPRGSFDVEAAADAAGISIEDLARARHRLGVISTQAPGNPRRWRLPPGEQS
jgi:ParB family chromosome partitioning protein